MDPEQAVASAQTPLRRFFAGPLGHWHLLLGVPLAVFALGVLVGSLDLLLSSTPLVGCVAMYVGIRVVLQRDGDLFWVTFVGFVAFVAVCVPALGWMFNESRPWMVETAEQRERQDQLLQRCTEQRLDAMCATPDCRASSYEQANDACIEDWLSECSALGEPGLNVDTLLYETRQHFDSLCTYFRNR